MPADANIDPKAGLADALQAAYEANLPAGNKAFPHVDFNKAAQLALLILPVVGAGNPAVAALEEIIPILVRHFAK